MFYSEKLNEIWYKKELHKKINKKESGKQTLKKKKRAYKDMCAKISLSKTFKLFYSLF